MGRKCERREGERKRLYDKEAREESGKERKGMRGKWTEETRVEDEQKGKN